MVVVGGGGIEYDDDGDGGKNDDIGDNGREMARLSTRVAILVIFKIQQKPTRG